MRLRLALVNLPPIWPRSSARRTLRPRRPAPASMVDGREMVAFCKQRLPRARRSSARHRRRARGRGAMGRGCGRVASDLGHYAPHRARSRAGGIRTATARARALLFSTGYMANLGDGDGAGRPRRQGVRRQTQSRIAERAVLLSRADFKRYPHSEWRRSRGCSRRRKRTASWWSPMRCSAWTATSRRCRIAGGCASTRRMAHARRRARLRRARRARGRGVLAISASHRPHHLHGDARQGGRRVRRVRRGAQELIETLRQTARTYIYTTATPPCLAMRCAEP